MTQQQNLNNFLGEMKKHVDDWSKDEVMIGLIGNIASSLAIIADSMNMENTNLAEIILGEEFVQWANKGGAE